MTRVAALRVKRGDRVSVHGRRHEVKAVRAGRYASGDLMVTLVFKSGSPLRMSATALLTVDRDGRAVR
ncbi:hypothetical protein ABZ721_11755 [Streptomyces sp. NPDC006733]|uniref:hypothetical protein n=1 Tax=Streptomyces sp. NPDC006733 TaxID=3155460 RepID=UPI0034076AE9